MSIRPVVNGERSLTLPVADRGLHYGDGVFRTMLVWDGKTQAQDQQLRKLRADANALSLPLPDEQTLSAAMDNMAHKLQRGVIKLTITAGDSQRGYARNEGTCRWILSPSALPKLPDSHWRDGVVIRDSSWPLSHHAQLAGIKHLNRLDQVMARRELPSDCHESLMFSADGHPISGGMSNLFWHADGCWYTPALVHCGVAGLMRDRIIGLLENTAQRVETVVPNREDLLESEVMILSNSVIGLWPVREWRDVQNQRFREWAKPAENVAFQHVRDLINHPWQGDHV